MRSDSRGPRRIFKTSMLFLLFVLHAALSAEMLIQDDLKSSMSSFSSGFDLPLRSDAAANSGSCSDDTFNEFVDVEPASIIPSLSYHCAVPVGPPGSEKIVIFGGATQVVENRKIFYRPSARTFILNPLIDSWDVVPPAESAPPGLIGPACTALDDERMIVFGGLKGLFDF